MGILDGPMRDVVEILNDVFTDNKITITRTTEVYSLALGTEVTTTKTVTLKASVPSNVESRDVDGEAILKGDQVLIVAASALESEDSTFGEPSPQTDTLTRGGTEYAIVAVKTIPSGDQEAGFKLFLRYGGGDLRLSRRT